MPQKADCRKLLFFVTEDWYFCTHRLPLAIAAMDKGYEVVVATRVDKHRALIEESGLRLIPLRKLKRSSVNPFRELSAVAELVKIYRSERPGIVHHVALKPVVYGTIAARIAGVRGVVNAMAGLGFIFSSQKRTARFLRPIIVRIFRTLLKTPDSRVIVQNRDDASVLLARKIVPQQLLRLIRGAGVDLRLYQMAMSGAAVPIVLLASRMLWDKGVGEFVEAAGILKKEGVSARFVLVGDTDTENPAAIPQRQLREWNQLGDVEWWGYRKDMPNVISEARIVCLPSYYGEGIPKVLLEAMASARPIVTTDMPGCRELVVENKNGRLVAPRDVAGLVEALRGLLASPQSCVELGVHGRDIVEREFSLNQVINETLDVYAEVCA